MLKSCQGRQSSLGPLRLHAVQAEPVSMASFFSSWRTCTNKDCSIRLARCEACSQGTDRADKQHAVCVQRTTGRLQASNAAQAVQVNSWSPRAAHSQHCNAEPSLTMQPAQHHRPGSHQHHMQLRAPDLTLSE